MSRSYYKNLRVGFCCGNNGPFYKARRRYVSNKNRHQLRNLIANFDYDAINEIIFTYKLKKRDTWNEPTDGSNIIKSKNTAIRLFGGWDGLERKILPNIKPRYGRKSNKRPKT